jgi:hypothetical protein
MSRPGAPASGFLSICSGATNRSFRRAGVRFGPDLRACLIHTPPCGDTRPASGRYRAYLSGLGAAQEGGARPPVFMGVMSRPGPAKPARAKPGSSGRWARLRRAGRRPRTSPDQPWLSPRSSRQRGMSLLLVVGNNQAEPTRSSAQPCKPRPDNLQNANQRDAAGRDPQQGPDQLPLHPRADVQDRLASQPWVNARESRDSGCGSGSRHLLFAQVRPSGDAGRQTVSGAVCAGSNPAGGAVKGSNSKSLAIQLSSSRRLVTYANFNASSNLCSIHAPGACHESRYRLAVAIR